MSSINPLIPNNPSNMSQADMFTPEGATQHIIKKTLDTVAKKTGEQAVEAIDAGVPHQNIIQTLFNNIGAGFSAGGFDKGVGNGIMTMIGNIGRAGLAAQGVDPEKVYGKTSMLQNIIDNAQKINATSTKAISEGANIEGAIPGLSNYIDVEGEQIPLPPATFEAPGVGMMQIKEFDAEGNPKSYSVIDPLERQKIVSDLIKNRQETYGTEDYYKSKQYEQDMAVEQAKRIEDMKPLTPEQAKDVAGAVTSVKSIDSIIAAIDKGVFNGTKILPEFVKKGAMDLGKSVLVTGELESVMSDFNSLRASIPFTKGGKQLTPFEAKVLYRLLATFGKSDATIKKDLQRFRDESIKIAKGELTEEQAKIMLEGLDRVAGEDAFADSAVKKSAEYAKKYQSENPTVTQKARSKSQKGGVLSSGLTYTVSE